MGKSKRRRGLLKKVLELHFLVDVEILVIIKDKEFKKYTVYNSSKEAFEPNVVNKMVKVNDNAPI